MRKLFKTIALLLAGLHTVFILAGCGGDEDSPEEITPAAQLLKASPRSGSTIAANGSITLTFDSPPSNVTASTGTVVPSSKNLKVVVVKGPFIPGPLNLMVNWADGSTTLSYTVTTPDCCSGGPIVIGGTVIDGNTGVSPEAINSEGVIELLFSEEATGNIALKTEAGDDLGWFGKVEGRTGRLWLVAKSRELKIETTYVITGSVTYPDGNEYRIKITFVTKGKA